MIFAVPGLTAVTNPVTGLTVATSVLLLLQVPPASPLLLYTAVEPIHNGELPVTVPETASGLTVSCLKAEAGLLQPDVTVYTMFVKPALKAVTEPVDGSTDATKVFELVQVPPVLPLLLYVEDAPMQSGEVPLMVPAVTSGFTVMVNVLCVPAQVVAALV